MASIPPDMKEKEKIVGGLLNINQLLWVIAGGVFGAILFGMTFLLFSSLIFSIILFVLGLVTSLPFVFYKRNDLTLYQYLKYSYDFKMKTKELPNVNLKKGVR